MNKEQASITAAFAFVALAIAWRHRWLTIALGWLKAAPGNALQGVSDAANAATGGNPAPPPQQGVANPNPTQAAVPGGPTNLPGIGISTGVGVPV